MRKKILKYVIKRLCKSSKRERIYRNLKELQTILVIFEIDQETAAESFMQQLTGLGKRAIGCGFQPMKGVINGTQTSHLLLSKKDFSWWGKVSPEILKNLQVAAFDALIDLSLKENLELEYLVASLNIPLKIGLKKNSLPIYDLAISDDSEKQKLSVEALEVHLLHYLHTIQ